MYILLALIIGLIIGFVRKGSIDSIFKHPYKLWYLGTLGIILMIFLHYYYLTNNAFVEFETYLPIINFISYLFILIMLIFNLDDVYTILISVGVILNFIVTFINGGYMPVSESVISNMPLYATLTQSIYTESNGIYTLMQSSQTLLGFLGVTFPIPFFVNIVTSLGTVPGLTPGDIFLLIGIIGVTQRAMVLNLKSHANEIILDYNSSDNQYAEPIKPKFESKTEELFFEDQLLPKNPLDKLFEDEEEEIFPTQVLPEIKPLKDIKPTSIRNEREHTQLLESLKELTTPIGFVEENDFSDKSIKKETKPVLEDTDGFFVSQYFSDREDDQEHYTDTITTNEIFSKETGPLTSLDSEALKFGIKKDDLYSTDTDLFSSKDLEKLNSISDDLESETEEEALEEFKPSISWTLEEENNEIDKSTIENSADLNIIEDNPNKPEEISVSTSVEEEEYESSDREDMLEDKLTPEEIEETNNEDQALDYDLDALKALLNNTPFTEEAKDEAVVEDEVTEPEETQEEVVVETDEAPIEELKAVLMQNLEEEAASNKRGAFEEDLKSGYIVNKTYLEEKSTIDNSEEKMRDIWSQVAKETRDRKLGRRRQASSNYVTSNPYKEEMARRRKAKEEKQERAKREREAFLELQREELSRHAKETEKILESTSPNPDDMTDEERLAAGYELVTFEVAGKTISFWKK